MPTTPFRNHALRLVFAALLWCGLQTGSLVQAQVQDRPKIGPEHKKLEAWVGTWSYQGTLHDSPMGPGGKFAGRETIRWTLDGLFLEGRGKDKGVYGGKTMTYEALSVEWYDAASRTYKSRSFDTDGFATEGVMTVSGNTWTSTGSATDSKGKRNLSRGIATFAPDGKSRSSKFEVSFDDGKTWSPLWELTAKKR